MVADFFRYLVAYTAIFEIGVNLAIIAAYLQRFNWLVFKMIATSMLLLFIALTMNVQLGEPPTWRLPLGGIAVLLDGVAIAWIWHAVKHHTLILPPERK